MLQPADLMHLAIKKCREGIEAGQSPFGCAIARESEVLAVCHNSVRADIDVTAHAEINCLREACKKAGDILLESAVVATTCEPCPMCMAALHWARVEVVYFGAAISDAKAAGFNELDLNAEALVRTAGSRVRIVPSLLADECQALFEEWRSQENAQPY